MVDVATLALEARTDGLKRAEAALDAVTNAAIRTDAAADKMTAGAASANVAVGNMGRSANAARGGFQNLGYQVQDFAVQVGAGTSASQALGQQLPQLLSGFGLLGVALGTAAALIVPLGSALLGAGDDARSFADAMDDATDALANMQEAATFGTAEGLAKLAEQYGAVNAALERHLELQLQLDMRTALEATRAMAAGLLEELDGWESSTENLSEIFPEMTGKVNHLITALHEMGEAGSFEDQVRNLEDMRDLILKSTGGVQNMTSAQFAFYQKVQSSLDVMLKMRKASDDAGASMSRMPGILGAAQAAASSAAGAVASIGTAASNAYGAVSSLVSKMWEMGQARAAYSASVGGGRGNNPGGPALDPYGFRGQLDRDAALGGALGSGGGGGSAGSGGGGGASDGFDQRLASLTEELQTERETLDEWYAESQSILADRRAMEILGAEGHAAALLAIEEKMQAAKAELRDQDLSHYEGFFGAMAGALQSGGGKMLAISKGFALAEAAVSMYRGAAKALELPFPASLAAWGQVIATGAKSLAGIKSASFGGGGSAGGSSIGTPAVAAPSQDRNIRVNIEGDGMFAEALRGSIRQIADALGNERDIGGFVVA